VFPDDQLVLVMDNTSTYHSGNVHEFLALFEHRLRILWLPPYSPDLNCIERFCEHLKLRATTYRLFPQSPSID
jgi:transposase